MTNVYRTVNRVIWDVDQLVEDVRKTMVFRPFAGHGKPSFLQR